MIAGASGKVINEEVCKAHLILALLMGFLTEIDLKENPKSTMEEDEKD